MLVILGPNLPSIQFIYRKLHPLRTMFSSIIYVSNVRRPILCSSALLIGDFLSLPNTIPSIQFIYRKLHRHRTNIARVIIIFPYFFRKNGGHLGFFEFFEIIFCPCHFRHLYGLFIENRIKIESVVL